MRLTECDTDVAEGAAGDGEMYGEFSVTESGKESTESGDGVRDYD